MGSILDKLSAWLDRREVLQLRHAHREDRELILAQGKTIAEQVRQISSANHRVSYTTNANLELKKVLRDNGINSDGMLA